MAEDLKALAYDKGPERLAWANENQPEFDPTGLFSPRKDARGGQEGTGI